MSTRLGRPDGSAGPTLVLIPPVGLDEGCWDSVPLASATRVAFAGHPGHGSRPRSARPYDLDDLADEILAEHAGPLDLVGVSMGGMVAQHAALRDPVRVRSLVLAGTGANADPEMMLERARVAETEGVGAMLDETLRRWFTAEALGASPEHSGVTYARRTLAGLDSGAFADAWRAIAAHDVRERLGSIEAPTTCLAGGADLAAPPERMRALASSILGARVRMIAGAPHMIQLERPDEFGAELADHLRWVEGAG